MENSAKLTAKKKKHQKKEDVGGKLVMAVGSGMVRLALDVILYVFLVFAAIYCCHYAYDFCYQVFGAASVTDEENAYSMSITIYDGESTLDIAKRLEGYDLILNKYSFVVKSRLDKVAIKPGTFILSSDMDYDEILDIISDTSKTVKDEDKSEPDGGSASGGTTDGSSDGNSETENKNGVDGGSQN